MKERKLKGCIKNEKAKKKEERRENEGRKR